MPMSINFSEQGLKTLMSPPPPAQPLSDIILTIKVSKDLNALAMIGREVLRGCVSSRKYKPPILDRFELEVDEIISDRILARVARQSSLLERLKVHEVASDLTDIAHILCAYLGATFMCSFKSEGSNQIHESINDICAMVLDDSAREETEADSHERMLRIPGMERMKSPIKQEPAPSYSSSTRAPSTVSHIFDINSIESVSSGPGPVHTSNPATFAQPQPMYNTPPPPATIPSQTVYPTQPPGAMPLGGYPGMGMPQNPGFVPPAVAPPVPVSASQQNQGYISLVNELAMKNRRSITWQQAKVGQQHMPEWTMWLSVDGEVRGQGTAPTKQAAKEIASKLALQSMGWMQG
ncbi:unnamed protein product [Rhizoctonia solani]|uniref:DRBM domain-containing protein n=1 Tax=Rhizoctonia solani TaxID=456999 RepID=A0A8H3AZ21_9AGAM|nr:unnamed protein product [Rhizoctonia solani]